MIYSNSDGKKFNFYFSQGNIEKGVLPYILLIPENLSEGKRLVVESLNYEGTDVLDDILPHAKQQADIAMKIFDDAPILIPFIPDVKGGIPYYQQLSRECFEESKNGKYHIEYPRIDLQIIKTIEDAKEKLKIKAGKGTAEKIFLNGYSSSGVFAQRFALIHPEIVDSALIGGAAGSIPLPTNEFDYPLGVQDYEDLFGSSFNEDEYKRIKFAYYVSQFEANRPAFDCNIEGHPIQKDEYGKVVNKTQIIPPMHDMSYMPRSIDIVRGKNQRKKLGKDISERFKNCIDYYSSHDYNITSKIYRGAEHRGMFSKSNPSFDALIRDVRLFYQTGKSFEQDINGVNEISMEAQRQRENINPNALEVR